MNIGAEKVRGKIFPERVDGKHVVLMVFRLDALQHDKQIPAVLSLLVYSIFCRTQKVSTYVWGVLTITQKKPYSWVSIYIYNVQIINEKRLST